MRAVRQYRSAARLVLLVLVTVFIAVAGQRTTPSVAAASPARISLTPSQCVGYSTSDAALVGYCAMLAGTGPASCTNYAFNDPGALYFCGGTNSVSGCAAWANLWAAGNYPEEETVVACSQTLGLTAYCASLKNDQGAQGYVAWLGDRLVCALPGENLDWGQQAAIILKSMADGTITALPYVIDAAEGISCLSGVVVSCVDVGTKLLNAAHVNGDVAATLQAVSGGVNCVGGDATACTALAMQAANAAGVGGPVGKALSAIDGLERCTQEADACVSLGLALARDAGVDGPIINAINAANDLQQCANGYIIDCAVAGDAMAKAAGAGQFADQLLHGATIALACAQSDPTQDPSKCLLLGTRVADAAGAGTWVGEGVNCYQGDPSACKDLAVQAAKAAGVGVPLDDVSAVLNRAQQCASGDAANCAGLGAHAADALGLRGQIQDLAKGAADVNRCGQGDPAACATLGTNLMSTDLSLGAGHGVASDTSDCRNGEQTACQNLGIALTAATDGAGASSQCTNFLSFNLNFGEGTNASGGPSTPAPAANPSPGCAQLGQKLTGASNTPLIALLNTNQVVAGYRPVKPSPSLAFVDLTRGVHVSWAGGDPNTSWYEVERANAATTAFSAVSPHIPSAASQGTVDFYDTQGLSLGATFNYEVCAARDLNSLLAAGSASGAASTGGVVEEVCSDPVLLNIPVPTFQTQPVLWADPNGKPGGSTPVTGDAFPTSGKNYATLTLSPAGSYVGKTPPGSGVDLATVGVDSSGHFGQTVTIPSGTKPGSYTLTAEVGSDPHQTGQQLTVVAQTPVTAAAPPSAGQAAKATLAVVGSQTAVPNLAQQTAFTVSGQGFVAGQVQIYLDSAHGTPLATATADASGNFQVSVTIISTSGGNHQLIGQETAGGQTIASAPLTVYVQPALS
jgi:hypothetical protein